MMKILKMVSSILDQLGNVNKISTVVDQKNAYEEEVNSCKYENIY